MDAYREIDDLIKRVRARWRRLVALRAGAVAAVGIAAVCALALLVAQWTGHSPVGLALTGVATLVASLAVLLLVVWPIRRAPTDAQVARFIEEQEPSLDDRLVSAVDVAATAQAADAPALASAMVADASRRVAQVQPSAIVAPDLLRRAGVRAVAAALVLLVVGFVGRHAARRAFDALALTAFPATVRLDVTPGNARVQAGTPLAIEAKLAGNSAPVAAQLQRQDGDTWIAADMPPNERGAFSITLDALGDSFTYRVTAGSITSPAYDVTVVRPPRVTRIDVAYRYPPATGLAARTEEDAGDIYAPAGTDVRLMVHTDRDAASGRMAFAGGAGIDLKPAGAGLLEAALTITKDDSYRVRVADGEGMTSAGETEYFVRILDDRPPEVRLLKPARDRSVTRLEEVDIEAEAQDDFGIAQLDLVYAVGGGTEKVVPLSIPGHATTVTGSHTLYLEDLQVKPGDFVSYYVRARDVARGRRSSEARSDIFFLEVKPFEQEFSLASSQAQGGGSGSPQIDDLVNAQKEVIVATWKLDRRAEAAGGAKSEQDIRAVAKAEAELKTRVEETASAFRASTMRDPRRRTPQPGTPRAGQTMPEEDAMAAAARAMEKAVTALEGLKTKPAMAPELEALNRLLEAQGEVKERQITRQAGTGGTGQNRASQDLSSLFDKELARHQETNYETPTSAEQKDKTGDASMLDRIRELAQRQDELLRRQQELARQRQQMSPEELKRALEALTREQTELRRRTEELSRQTSSSERSEGGQRNQPGRQPQGRQQNDQQQGNQQSSQPAQTGQGDGRGQAGRPGDSGERRPSEQGTRSGTTGDRLREVSEEMRQAANELRRQETQQGKAGQPQSAQGSKHGSQTGSQAGSQSENASGSRALDKLRDLERQLQSAAPDEPRRALGELQLEARQLADAQREVSAELGRVGGGESSRDALRRMAGEEDRLAERVQRLEQNLDRQAKGADSSRVQESSESARRNGRTGSDEAGGMQRAAGEAARDLQGQRLDERMEQSANEMRARAGNQAGRAGTDSGRTAGQSENAQPSPQTTARNQEEIARALDRLADRLGAAMRAGDDESRKLTDQLARAQELREKMETTSRQLERLGQQRGQSGGQPGGQQSGRGPNGQQPASAPGPPNSGRDGTPSAQSEGAGATGTGSDVARLQEEYKQQLRQTKELLDELERDRTAERGGAGFTFEGQGMVLSAPGTEAFKQDFTKWEELRRQATQALERVEVSLSQRLQAKGSKDRLAGGVDDRPPAEYREQVDSYFKALAEKKKP